MAIVHGTAAGETLYGTSGSDTLYGYGGNDLLIGGTGLDTLDGGSGTDTVTYGARSHNVTVDLAAGSARVYKAGGGWDDQTLTGLENAIGGSGNDTLTGNALANVLTGADGNDTLSGGAGDDTLHGGNGLDVLSGGDGNDLAYGGTGTDWMLGGAGNDILLGESGDDSLSGEAGNDTLEGGSGNDSLNGGAGNDILLGGAGSDTIDGGAGFDTLMFNGAAQGVVLDLAQNQATSGSDVDTVTGIEKVVGSVHADTLRGNAATLELHGQGGNDFIYSAAGAQVLSGGDGNDTVGYLDATSGRTVNLNDGTGSDGDQLTSFENVYGSQYADTLTGTGGANRLTGNNGNDVMNGLGGNDALRGGQGGDQMWGGSGADTFVYTNIGDSSVGQPVDRIMDFSKAQGDKIDLSAFGLDFEFQGLRTWSTPYLNEPTLSYSHATNASGQATTLLHVGTDNDNTFEMVIEIAGQVSLAESDFLFG